MWLIDGPSLTWLAPLGLAHAHQSLSLNEPEPPTNVGARLCRLEPPTMVCFTLSVRAKGYTGFASLTTSDAVAAGITRCGLCEEFHY